MCIRDWESFKEFLEHDIQNCDLILNVEGYRVDEKKKSGYPQGIRNHCLLKSPQGNNIKCCDYFYLWNDKFFCLEFSDIALQLEYLTDIYESLLDKKTDKAQRHYLKKFTPQKHIQIEIQEKFVDTEYLLAHLYGSESTRISNLPSHKLPKYFFLIWHQKDLDNIDCARFLDFIQDKLKDKLARQPFVYLDINKIYFITLTIFQQKYCVDNE